MAVARCRLVEVHVAGRRLQVHVQGALQVLPRLPRLPGQVLDLDHGAATRSAPAPRAHTHCSLLCEMMLSAGVLCNLGACQ